MAAIFDVGEDQQTQICLEEDHQRSITYKFGPIWPCGSWEDQNVKKTTDNKWWEKLTWDFGSGELKLF